MRRWLSGNRASEEEAREPDGGEAAPEGAPHSEPSPGLDIPPGSELDQGAGGSPSAGETSAQAAAAQPPAGSDEPAPEEEAQSGRPEREDGPQPDEREPEDGPTLDERETEEGLDATRLARRPRHKPKHSARPPLGLRLRRRPREAEDGAEQMAEAGASGGSAEAPGGEQQVQEEEQSAPASTPPEGAATPGPAGRAAGEGPMREDPAAGEGPVPQGLAAEKPAPEDGTAEEAPSEEPAAAPQVAEVPERGPGPRRAALQERRTRSRKMTLAGAAGLAVVAVGVVAGVAALAGRVTAPSPPPVTAPAPAPEKLATTLVVGTTDGARGETTVKWLTLLSYDDRDGKGGVVYIPAHTAVEVPGRGLQTLSESLRTGGIPLLLVTAENLLKVRIDHHIELSPSAAKALFQSTGPLVVDVPAEVNVRVGKNQTRPLFSPGRQELPADFLVKLLYTVGDDGDDIELGGRHLAFWDALFDTFGGDPGNLREALKGAGAVLGDSDATVDQQLDLFGELAGAPEEKRSLMPLPVQPYEVPNNVLYVTKESELEDFVASVVGVEDQPSTDSRVQILNGNGVPGIGQAVATKLVGEGFNVILTGNANHLDYPRTLIVVYDADDQTLAAARRAKELLGTGQVQVSGQEQGIVDLTIVVGKDFQRDP